MAGDRDGNGWWTQISIDIIGHSDIETGKSMEIKVAPNTNTFLKARTISLLMTSKRTGPAAQASKPRAG